MQKRLQGPLFYGDLVHIFKQIIVRTDFSDQFRKVIVTHRLIGYNLNVMQYSACLAINQITVNKCVANSTSVDRASDTTMVPKEAIHFSWPGPELFCMLLVHLVYFVYLRFSVVLCDTQ